MVLRRIDRASESQRCLFDGQNVIGAEIFSDLPAGSILHTERERIGDVDDILVDESNRPQYVLLNVGTSRLGRFVLLPINRVQVDPETGRFYATNMAKDAAERLPEFNPRIEREPLA